MGYSNFFNLIADVICSAIENHSFIDVGILEDDDLEKINQEIDGMLTEKIGDVSTDTYDKKLFDSETCEGIIEWCRERNDKYIYLYLLRKLDRMINEDFLCSDYGMEQMAHRNRQAAKEKDPESLKGKYIEPYFEALNTNLEETGLMILPSFRVISKNDDEKQEGKEIGRMSGLNDALHHFSYIKKDELLPGYRIKNVIIDPGRRFEQIQVGFTPTTNKGKEEVFEVGKDNDLPDDSGHKFKYLGEITLRDKEGATKNYVDCLRRSREENFGVLLGTEMFGTEELCETRASGMNPLYANDENRPLPFLIVTPSLWKNKSNAVSVFTAGGELIGKQYKQFPFTYKGEKKECLKDIPREILLVHVRGIGKFAFPICFDLLNKEYRNLLINKLKTDFLMCPSYSSESLDFERVILEAVSAGSYVFWLNSCSAVAKKDLGLIGSVLVPKEKSEDSVKKICPGDCDGNCGTCLFSITVPIKRIGRLGHVEGDIDIKHIML